MISLGFEKTICVCREGQKSSTGDKSCEYCEGEGSVFLAKWMELEQLIPKILEKYPTEIEGTSGADQEKGRELSQVLNTDYVGVEYVGESQRVLNERSRKRSANDPPKFYVASKVKHYQMWLEYKEFYNIISTWIMRMPPSKMIDGVEDRNPEEWEEVAVECMREAAECDVLIFYGCRDEIWRGGFMEIGSALGAGKRVYVVLEEGIEAGSLGQILLPHPNVFRANSITEAFEEGFKYVQSLRL